MASTNAASTNAASTNTTTVDERVRALAIARIAFGTAMALAPARTGRPFLGDVVARPAGRTAVRMIGGRDAAIGLGQLLALRHGAPARGWVEAGGLADATDVAAALLAWRALPKVGRVLLVGFAAAGVATARALAPSLE